MESAHRSKSRWKVRRLALAALVVCVAAAVPTSGPAQADSDVLWFRLKGTDLSCQMSHNYGGDTSTLCQTVAGKKYKRSIRVVLRPSQLNICWDPRCLSNGPVNATIRAKPGRTFKTGPFRCGTRKRAIVCRVEPSGRGFKLYRTRVRLLS